MIESYAPNGVFEYLSFILDSRQKWSAINVKYDWLWTSDSARNKIPPIKQIIPEKGFDSLLNMLYEIDLFTLPDQKKLKKKSIVFDGSMFTVSFKIGNNYRMYHFDNPEIYEKRYPKTKAFKKYKALLYLFLDGFTEK